MRGWLFLLFSAANYEPSTFPRPQKSCAPAVRRRQRTASAGCSPRCFSLFRCKTARAKQQGNRQGSTPALVRVADPRRYRKCTVMSISRYPNHNAVNPLPNGGQIVANFVQGENSILAVEWNNFIVTTWGPYTFRVNVGGAEFTHSIRIVRQPS